MIESSMFYTICIPLKRFRTKACILYNFKFFYSILRRNGYNQNTFFMKGNFNHGKEKL